MHECKCKNVKTKYIKLLNIFKHTLSLTSNSDCSFPVGGIKHLSLNTMTIVLITAPNLLLSDIMIPALVMSRLPTERSEETMSKLKQQSFNQHPRGNTGQAGTHMKHNIDFQSLTKTDCTDWNLNARGNEL